MLGIEPCNFALKRGIPSKRKSSACVDYVPALCTHRPSLLPIEWLSEALGLAQRGRQRPLRAGNLVKLGHLEEVKVVTRFPLKGSFLEAFPHDDSNHTCAVRSTGDVTDLLEHRPRVNQQLNFTRDSVHRLSGDGQSPGPCGSRADEDITGRASVRCPRNVP